MPPLVINLRKARDRRDVVHRAVQTLVEGKLVVFPTETVYGVAASVNCPEAVEAIFTAKGRPKNSPLALVVKGYEDALDYVPKLDGVAQRLARRCWPGPVTLVAEHGVANEQATVAGESESLVSQFSQPVFDAVSLEGRIGLRVPSHDVIHEVLRMLAGPLVLSSANLSGQSDPITGIEAAENLKEHATLVVDDGPCQFGQASTVVSVERHGWKCLREGAVPRDTIERLTSMLILVVCTGNTCRSPMAEGLLKVLLADKLGCEVEQLPSLKVRVASAGVSAAPACAASPEAVDVLAARGIDISNHQSQPLSEPLMCEADLILTLTSVHRQAIVQRWPESAARTVTLRSDGGDVSDPIGAPEEVYRQCAEQIEAALRERLETLTIE